MSTSTVTGKAVCIQCGKERSAVRCEGCLKTFCYNHFADHRQELSKKLDDIEITRDMFRDALNLQTDDLDKHSLMKQIDDWKAESIEKIEQIAEECKKSLVQYIADRVKEVETDFNKLTEKLRQIRHEDDYNEADLTQLSGKLKQLTMALQSSVSISIKRNSASPVDKISIVNSSSLKDTRSAENSHTNQKDGNDQLEDLQRANKDLNERLSFGAEEYKILFRKYTKLEQRMALNDQKQFSPTSLVNDPAIQECPMCNWQFPENVTVDFRKQHIDNHFA